MVKARDSEGKKKDAIQEERSLGELWKGLLRGSGLLGRRVSDRKAILVKGRLAVEDLKG